jgi:hypothetical protein
MKDYRSAEEALAYYAECALATVEGLPVGHPRSRRKRLESIAQGMVDAVRDFGGGRDYGNARLARRLRYSCGCPK